jgi:hypothetical protein
MKEYWAAKRAKAAKPISEAKAPKVQAKARAKNAQKKAMSLKMREIWKKRKSAAARAKPTVKPKATRLKKQQRHEGEQFIHPGERKWE